MEEKIYGGLFKILGKNYNGQIRYLKEKYILLEIHLQTAILSDSEFNFKNSIVYGDLITGTKVTLHNCSYLNHHTHISYGKTIVFIRCEYMIWGNHIEGKIKSLSFELENAIQWSGLSGLIQKNYDGDFFDCIKYKHGNRETIEFRDYKLTLFTSYRNELSAYPKPENGNITERLCIKIEHSHNKPINELLQVMTDFCDIITFCIGNNINIIKARCEEENSYYLNSGKKEFFNMEISGVFKSKHIFKQQMLQDIVSLDMIKGKVLERFLSEYQEIKHIIELYVLLIINSELPNHIQYINIIQALESFHSKFICENFKDYLKSIDSRYKESEYYEFYKSFLLPEQQGKSDFIVLTSRINDCFSRLPRVTLDYFKDNTISTKLTDTRHYFTHYSKIKYEKSLKNKNLEIGISLLCLTLNYLIWKHFGLNRDEYLIQNLEQLNIDKMKNDND